MKISIFVMIIFLFVGCGEDIKKENLLLKQTNTTLSNEKQLLTIENESLKKEIDELKNGASRLYAIAKKQFDEKQYSQSIQALKILIEKQPASNEANEAKSLIGLAEKEIKKQENEIATKKSKDEQLEKERIEKAMSKMTIKKDEIEKLSWYIPKSMAKEFKTHTMLYFGRKFGSSSNNMRLKTVYHADSWLFIKSMIIVIDDEQFPFENIKFTKDNGSSIWEWNDMQVTIEMYSMIEKMIKSKKTVIRFYGDKYKHDHIVSQREKQAMQDTLDASMAY